jgi:hypothetical protein
MAKTNAKAVEALVGVDQSANLDRDPMSLKDGAYQQAKAGDRIRSVAKYVMANAVGFPETVADEVKEQLNEGYRLRFNENNPPDQYAVVDGNYLLIDGSNPDLANAREKISVGVDYACVAFTQQQFGKLKNENPALYAIIKSWRDRVSTYCSNRLGDLKRQAKAILNEGKKRERSATADFAKRIEDTFSDLATKCKTASARGDETANEAKFREARVAFMVKWNAV